MNRIGCAASQLVFLFFCTSSKGECHLECDLVKVAPLVKSPGYSLQNEDPSVYSDGEDFYRVLP